MCERRALQPFLADHSCRCTSHCGFLVKASFLDCHAFCLHLEECSKRVASSAFHNQMQPCSEVCQTNSVGSLSNACITMDLDLPNCLQSKVTWEPSAMCNIICNTLDPLWSKIQCVGTCLPIGIHSNVPYLSWYHVQTLCLFRNVNLVH